jgi:hypothetical protein
MAQTAGRKRGSAFAVERTGELANSRMPLGGFFETLGHLAGSRHEENQISRTFKACFGASTMFRQVILDLLAQECGVAVTAMRRFDWRCTTEEPVANGRLDIRVRADDPRSPEFILESKVGYKLTMRQLRHYRKHPGTRTTFLIAITKNRPDIPKRQLDHAGIQAIRWQDVHRVMIGLAQGSPVDRFIARSFAEYLETSGMAYREHLTVSDIKQASVL